MMSNTKVPHYGETFDLGDDYVLVNVHAETVCRAYPCVIHRPTEHHMSSWYLHWRGDRGIFERLCPTHGVGHPDPDQFDYWVSINQEWQTVHGCCGCCIPPTQEEAV